MPRHARILLGLLIGTLLGILSNLFLPQGSVNFLVRYIADPLGQIFLRLIFMLVVPLVVSALIVGISELGEVRSLGRVGVKVLLYTVVASSISVILGISLVQWIQPGRGLDPSIQARLLAEFHGQTQQAINLAQKSQNPIEILVSLIPKNPIAAAAEALDGGMLSLMVFSLFFGLGLILVPDRVKEPVVRLLEGVRDVSMRLIDLVMGFAPIGVAGLVYTMTGRFGIGILRQIAFYVAVVIGGLLIQQFIVYSGLLRILGGISPRWFFKNSKEVMLTAFSTASSNATLPLTLEIAERNLGLPRKLATFVLTVGSTANQNGTALFEGVTVLFLAQVFGVHLTLAQQVTVVLMSILAGIGTAGVPGGSIPLIVILLQSVGIPGEGIGIILGVDRLLDMCRTTLNVTGDMVIATLLSRSEKAELPPGAYA
ncbi:MAG: dicarboxylate/amino acid:cation symporter [Deltaproteobacteria bacterium]|nr:dicarboxylate/amino acid:cation symporter [Deltaproteobacteria bacterium]